MEHKPMWDAVMGFAYVNMGEFDDAFNASAFAKLPLPATQCAGADSSLGAAVSASIR
jgi:hypothetical protein